MALAIHPNARKQLLKTLRDVLPRIEVRNQMFIHRPSAIELISADFSLPRTGKLHDALTEYIDDFPFLEFVLDTIGKELYEIDRYDSENSPQLAEIVEYADIDATANRLIEQFDSLPWTYMVTIPLPESLSDLLPSNLDEFLLSKSARLVRPTEAFSQKFPLTSANKARENRLKGATSLLSMFLDAEPEKWNTETIHLQIELDGFIGIFGGSATAQRAERIAKTIFGLGLANRLFEFELRYMPSPTKVPVYVHRKNADGGWDAETRYDLPESIGLGISGLKIAQHSWLDSKEKEAAWSHWRKEEIAVVFRAGEQAEQITLAAQWLFDSYGGQDSLLSLIQSMVVMEILFGDKSISDEIGIGELISSRFAYLIGTTHEERADLIMAIKKIYKVRSQIVHRGKHRLTLEDRALFSRLRWMCRRAIDKEIDFLKEAESKKKPALEVRK